MSGLRRCPVFRGRKQRNYFDFYQIELLEVSGLRKCPVYRVSGLRRFYCTIEFGFKGLPSKQNKSLKSNDSNHICIESFFLSMPDVS